MPEDRHGSASEPTRHTDTSQQTSGRGAVEDARAAADRKRQELQETARRQAEDLKQEATRQAEAGKGFAADRVHSVARALRSAGDTLEREGQGQVAGLGREAADQVESLAGYLERNDVNGLVRDLERTARRNPALFFGGLFVGGLLLGRVLRAGDPDRRAPERRFDSPYDYPSQPGRAPLPTRTEDVRTPFDAAASSHDTEERR